jgi:hypothetical protein
MSRTRLTVIAVAVLLVAVKGASTRFSARAAEIVG